MGARPRVAVAGRGRGATGMTAATAQDRHLVNDRERDDA
jgi:hypothetical protein